MLCGMNVIVFGNFRVVTSFIKPRSSALSSSTFILVSYLEPFILINIRFMLDCHRWGRSNLSCLISLVACRRCSPRTHTGHFITSVPLLFSFLHHSHVPACLKRDTPRFKMYTLRISLKTRIFLVPLTKVAFESRQMPSYIQQCSPLRCCGWPNPCSVPLFLEFRLLSCRAMSSTA